LVPGLLALSSSNRSKVSLTGHQENIHLQLVRFKCNICVYDSYLSSAVQYHQKVNHADNLACKVVKIGCELCNENIPNHNHKRQIERISERNSLKERDIILCEECKNGIFPTLQSRLKQHKLEHKTKNIFNCKHCENGSNYLPNLETHINSQHLKKKLQCPKCSFQTTWKPLFFSHMRETHNEYQKNSKHRNFELVICNECGKTINSIAQFKTHYCRVKKYVKKGYKRPNRPRRAKKSKKVEVKVNIKSYRCSKCEFTTDNPSNVKGHYELSHKTL